MKFADLLTMMPDPSGRRQVDEFGVSLSLTEDFSEPLAFETTILYRLRMMADVMVWCSPEQAEEAGKRATQQLLAGIYGDTLKELAVLRSAIYAGNRGEAMNAAQRIEDHILGRNL